MDNKTKISTPPPVPEQAAAPSNSFYTQSAGAPDNRTFIPGMKRKTDKSATSDEPAAAESLPLRIEFQSRPVAGILYSVSRDTYGEIFPVYVGRNVIGSSPESDVYLTEETVSNRHAILLVRVIPTPDGKKHITRTISDTDSDFGTTVNDEIVSDDIMPVAPGDIIRFGNAYQFAFFPLDADALGLKQAPNFAATPRVENRPLLSNDYMTYMMPAVDNNIYPNAVGEEDEFTFYGRTKKKKEDHSNLKTI